jgi:hypothetical protein
MKRGVVTKQSGPQDAEVAVAPRRSLIERLEDLLVAPGEERTGIRENFWLWASFAFSLYFTARALWEAFASDYVVQDDARQHVFWTLRYFDPELLAGDLIADYFQSVAPAGYTAMYRVAAAVGIDPLLLGKLLPVPLALVITYFSYGLSMRIIRVPAAAFFATLIMNEGIWMRNGLVSSTPRAFLYPLFLAFLFYLTGRNRWLCLVPLALMGLFYPTIMLVSLGVLMLEPLKVEGWRLRLSRERSDYLLPAAGLAVALAVLLPYAGQTSAFGPTYTGAEARAMPEFQQRGRLAFFHEGFWRYWVTGKGSGMATWTFLPITISIGFLLPILAIFPGRFPLIKQVTRSIALLAKIAVVSIALFFAAHLLLFKLYFPSRYTVSPLRVVLAFAAGISLVALLEAVFRWARQNLAPQARLIATAVASAAILALAIYPVLSPAMLDTRYITGKYTGLYEFFQSQPKDTLIASLSQEADNFPVFTRRPVLVGREYSLPLHRGFYIRMQERAVDLIKAHYAADLDELQSFIRKYGVDYLVVDRQAFESAYLDDKWIRQYEEAAQAARSRIQQGEVPALARLMDSCAVATDKRFVVISAECVLGRAPR